MQGFYTCLLYTSPILYYSVIGRIQYLYDVCLVRTFEDEAAVQLVRASAVDRCCLVQLVFSVF